MKMYSKIVFLFATLYVVNASVITLNGVDDDVQSLVETGDSPISGRCNVERCNQRCQSLNFSRGVCVRGRCKCDNLRTSEASSFGYDVVNNEPGPEQTLDEVEDTVMETGIIDPEFTDSNKKLKCFPRICNRVCRLLRFENGTCVDGRCKCARKVKESPLTDDTLDSDAEKFEQTLDEVEVDTALEIAGFAAEQTDADKKLRCFPRICNRMCRLFRFEGGTCVAGRCKCARKDKETSITEEVFNTDAENFKQTLGEVEDDVQAGVESEASPQLRICINLLCNRRCQGLKFSRGVCVNGRCKCDNLRTFEDTVIETEKVESELTDSDKKLRCFPRICNSVCRLFRFEGGTCVDGRCKCARKDKESTLAEEVFNNDHKEFKQTLNEVEGTVQIDEESEASPALRICINRLCNRRCQGLQFSRGVCVKGRCMCDNLRKFEESSLDEATFHNVAEKSALLNEKEDDVMENAGTSSDSTDSSNKLRCIPRVCNRVCRWLRFDNGTCVNGRCKCGKKESHAPERTVVAELGDTSVIDEEERTRV